MSEIVDWLLLAPWEIIVDTAEQYVDALLAQVR